MRLVSYQCFYTILNIFLSSYLLSSTQDQFQILSFRSLRDLYSTQFKCIYFCKYVFLEKSSFFGNKTVNQRFGANLKKCVICKNLGPKSCCKFLAYFSFFAEKILKMTISTSVWSAQHRNAG